MFRAHKIFLRTKLQVFAEFDALGLLTMPFLGNGFVMDRLVVPCVLLMFMNPVMAPVTFWFWGIVAYTPTADEEEYDEWRGRVRHFETRVSEIVDHRSDQTEQRASEQMAEMRTETRGQNAELRAELREQGSHLRELREQNAELRADIALLLKASGQA